jgi:hypothetical protein
MCSAKCTGIDLRLFVTKIKLCSSHQHNISGSSVLLGGVAGSPTTQTIKSSFCIYWAKYNFTELQNISITFN